LAFALTLSGAYQPWLAKYLGDWKTFNWAIFAQMITIVIVPFLLTESCRWLIGQGDKEKTIKILKKIARINKKEVPEHLWRRWRLCVIIRRNKRTISRIWIYSNLRR